MKVHSATLGSVQAMVLSDKHKRREDVLLNVWLLVSNRMFLFVAVYLTKSFQQAEVCIAISDS